jgi:radical SAM-linked protein
MLVRLQYSKTQEGRFLSHLDLLRMMERTFRRAGLKLAFSEGFNPHPKLSFASALAVGTTSSGEYLDVELREDIAPEALREKLQAALPGALEITRVKIMEQRGESLSALINLARYEVRAPLQEETSAEELNRMIADVLARPEIFVIRDGKKGKKQVDIRKGLYLLDGRLDGGQIILTMDVQTGSEGNVRPEEVLETLRQAGDLKFAPGTRVHRQGLFIQKDEGIRTPLDLSF